MEKLRRSKKQIVIRFRGNDDSNKWGKKTSTFIEFLFLFRLEQLVAIDVE